MVFRKSFKDVSRVFLDCKKGVSKKFLDNFQGVSKKIHVAWHSAQLPEYKEGLFLYKDFYVNVLVPNFFGCPIKKMLTQDFIILETFWSGIFLRT